MFDADSSSWGRYPGGLARLYAPGLCLVPLLWGMPFALALGPDRGLVTTLFLSMIVAAMAVWYGGWLDGLVQRLIEGIMILPVIAIGVDLLCLFQRGYLDISGDDRPPERVRQSNQILPGGLPSSEGSPLY